MGSPAASVSPARRRRRTTIAELAGFGASFSPDGSQVAYLKLAVTPEMQRLETSAEQADTAERTRLTSTLAALTETASRITIRQLATGASVSWIPAPGGKPR